MKQIAENIIIETEYTGVTLGAIIQPDRIIYIDAPLLPEHARLWRNAATGRKKLPQQVILMDANHDRTIGSRYLECTIIAQERTHWIYQNRPVTFKPISQNSGCGAAFFAFFKDLSGFFVRNGAIALKCT